MTAFGAPSCQEVLSSCDLSLQAADVLIKDQRGVIDSQAALLLAQKERLSTLEQRGTAFYEKEWFWFAAGAIGGALIIREARQ